MGRLVSGFALTSAGFAGLYVGVVRLAGHDLAGALVFLLLGLGAARWGVGVLRPFVAE